MANEQIACLYDVCAHEYFLGSPVSRLAPAPPLQTLPPIGKPVPLNGRAPFKPHSGMPKSDIYTPHPVRPNQHAACLATSQAAPSGCANVINVCSSGHPYNAHHHDSARPHPFQRSSNRPTVPRHLNAYNIPHRPIKPSSTWNTSTSTTTTTTTTQSKGPAALPATSDLRGVQQRRTGYKGYRGLPPGTSNSFTSNVRSLPPWVTRPANKGSPNPSSECQAKSVSSR